MFVNRTNFWLGLVLSNIGDMASWHEEEVLDWRYWIDSPIGLSMVCTSFQDVSGVWTRLENKLKGWGKTGLNGGEKRETNTKKHKTKNRKSSKEWCTLEGATLARGVSSPRLAHGASFSALQALHSRLLASLQSPFYPFIKLGKRISHFYDYKSPGRILIRTWDAGIHDMTRAWCQSVICWFSDFELVTIMLRGISPGWWGFMCS